MIYAIQGGAIAAKASSATTTVVARKNKANDYIVAEQDRMMIAPALQQQFAQKRNAVATAQPTCEGGGSHHRPSPALKPGVQRQAHAAMRGRQRAGMLTAGAIEAEIAGALALLRQQVGCRNTQLQLRTEFP